jgi:hypothetical protein
MRMISSVSPDQVGQPDIVDLGEFCPEFAGHPRQVVGRNRIPGFLRRRQGQRDDGDIIDAAPDDHRFGNADRNPVEIGAHLVMHPQDRRIRLRADDEARRDQHFVVGGLRVDMLDPVDALDDGLERFGDKLDGVIGLQARCAQHDVDHRHRDLRLFLARQRQKRHDAEGKGREQEQAA